MSSESEHIPPVAVVEDEEVIGRLCKIPSLIDVVVHAEAGAAVRGRVGVARGDSVVLHNVCAQIGSKPLVEDTDIVLKAGCRYGLVAKNGEGKSVILKLIATGTFPHIQEHVKCVYVQREAKSSATPCDEFVMRGAGELAAW